jgi:hypothetical protein
LGLAAAILIIPGANAASWMTPASATTGGLFARKI